VVHPLFSVKGNVKIMDSVAKESKENGSDLEVGLVRDVAWGICPAIISSSCRDRDALQKKFSYFEVDLVSPVYFESDLLSQGKNLHEYLDTFATQFRKKYDLEKTPKTAHLGKYLDKIVF